MVMLFGESIASSEDFIPEESRSCSVLESTTFRGDSSGRPFSGRVQSMRLPDWQITTIIVYFYFHNGLV